MRSHSHGVWSDVADLASLYTGIPPKEFIQALVAEYAPGAGIGRHRDKPVFQRMAALSFSAPCTLRLRRKTGKHAHERQAAEIAPRPARTGNRKATLPR